MKYEILDIITEAYDNDEISPEDALAYADFVECADLSDGDDVEILTEMVDILSWDDDYYMTEGRNIGKKVAKEKKVSKFKAKLANAKAAISRNKGKILAGAAIAGGVGAAVGAGYAAGRSGSNRRHAGVIQGLTDELSKKSADYDKVKNAFKQANDKKRTTRLWNSRLRDQRDNLRDELSKLSKKSADYDKVKNAFKQANNMKRTNAGALNAMIGQYSNLSGEFGRTCVKNCELSDEVRNLRKDAEAYKLHKRADAYRKALAHAGDSIKNRASVNLDDVNKPSVGPYAKARAGLGDYIKNRTSVNINDVRNPVTQDQLDELNRKLNMSRSNRKRKR